MKKIRIGWRHSARVRSVLGELGSDQTIPSDLRKDAAYWSRAMTRKMHERDLRTVAWLLLDASGEHSVPFVRRRTARYWASYLERRI
jgi:uncharacterized protein (UPF0147 family)